MGGVLAFGQGQRLLRRDDVLGDVDGRTAQYGHELNLSLVWFAQTLSGNGRGRVADAAGMGRSRCRARQLRGSGRENWQPLGHTPAQVPVGGLATATVMVVPGLCCRTWQSVAWLSQP